MLLIRYVFFSVLKVNDARELTVIFKSSAISEIINLFLVTNIPTEIINKLNKIQNQFIWNGTSLQIKRYTLCNRYENAALKNVDILSKSISLQCSWIKLLYYNSSRPWKIMLSYLIDTYLWKSFKFHSNLNIPANKIKCFPISYKQIIKWGEALSSFPNLPSAIVFEAI